jgi:hypothetical protein
MLLNKKNKKNISGWKKYATVVLLTIVLFSSAIRPVYAFDPFTPIIAAWNGLQYVWDKVQWLDDKLTRGAGSFALQTAISRTMSTIAYDTATWLVSGGTGQKPQWFTGTARDEWTKVGQAAEGSFISSLNDQFGGALCEPSLDVKIKIGLGLQNIARPPQPDCTWQKMKANWSQALNSKDFLKNFANSFDIQQNDLGIALTAQTNLLNEQEQAILNKQAEIGMNGRYTENTSIAGDILGLPNQARTEQTFADNMYYANLGQFTGDALKDAAQVFLNQLAITGFHTAMRKIGETLNKSNAGSASNSLANSGAAPQSGGISGVQGALNQIAKLKFDSPGDFDILSQLSSCNKSIFGFGPTNCVIDERFRQAIINKKTVREALSDGYLQGNAPLGYKMSGDNDPPEPDWNSGYPYRSLIILRKYRIIPVGWEIAAEYIRTHSRDQDVAGMNTLNKLTACFADDSQPAWCRGLIDPDWVLKAPLNYCAKEGYGPQILNTTIQDQGVDNQGNKLSPKLIVTRADSYCADEKTCIQEKSDGSCNNSWGYCTEDKRIWKFGADSSCSAQYNTCQTYTSEAGGTVSFLKNSLQFCDDTQAGCEKYAIASSNGYNSGKNSLDWTRSSEFIFLKPPSASGSQNNNQCEQSKEGCHEFLRISSGLGTNLIADSDFDADSSLSPAWADLSGGASISSSLPGNGAGQGVYVNSNGQFAGIVSFDHSDTGQLSVLPAGFVMEPEVSYTLSADVYLVAGDRVTVGIGRINNFAEQGTDVHNSWQRISVTLLNNQAILANEFGIFGFSSNGGQIQFYIDNVKFEVGKKEPNNKVGDYSGYRDNNLVYEKFMPDYLRDACYTDPDNGDFSLKNNASPACKQFAPLCNREDVNCERYTKNTDGSKVAAAVTEADYCLSECVGYNTYIQAENNFSSNHLKYFIPDTAKSCALSAVGCEEFTNLASSTAGGERKEYYSYLRQCVKPSEASCGDFYSFESTQSQGQQLVRYSLSQIINAGNEAEPDTTSNDSLLCSEFIYNLPPTDPAYNPDCRQFYNKQGQIFYHLYSRTISCTNDCHSYRLTRKNVLENVDSQANCNPAAVGNTALANAFHWDNVNNVCDYCKNGGVWSDEQQGCVYKALISESATCAAADNGCSQYNGNGGANNKIISNSDFENNNTDGWSGGAITATSYVSGKNSYLIGGSGSIQKNITHATSGVAYTLTFLARSENSDANLTAEFSNGSGIVAFEKSAAIKSGQWRIYSLNLPNLNQTVNSGEFLTIKVSGAATVYVDDIKLEQITDRYYLLADSWNTPASCDQDNNHNPFPLYMLGCSEYTDRLNNIAYLHSLDRLCQDTAVGCEAMIDTANSVSADADNSYGATTTIPADHLVYAVYDTGKLCDSSNKGCERLGLTTNYAGEFTYKDAYLKNNPDAYSSILCGASGVGCNLFTSTEGNAYFKDPGNVVCEWRQAAGVANNNGWGWYKKKVSRCGGTGDICSSDKNCAGGSCRQETADVACPTEKLKTISTGGSGNEVKQPGSDGVNNWVGLCPADQSGCTEYIDPQSDFSSNIIFNGDFRQHTTGASFADGWKNVAGNGGVQNITLEGNTLYILTVKSDNSSNFVSIGISAGNPPFYELGMDNKFSAATSTILVAANQSKTFYVDRNVKGEKITFSDVRVQSLNNSQITLKKAVVDYQLDGSVNRKDCNSVANISNGCVYFNERSVKSTGLETLNSNSFVNYDQSALINTNPSLNNANALLKVSPDRVCAKWLACKSYVKDEKNDNVCFDVANCDRLDDSGQCANFTVLNDNQKDNRTFDPNNKTAQENTETIKNLTGYVKVGLLTANPITDYKAVPKDLLNFGQMKQVGENITVPNGDFELFTATSTDGGKNWVADPSGWTSTAGAGWTPDAADSLFSAVSDPTTAGNLGIVYPMIGKAFLRYSATNDGTDLTQGHFPRSSVIRLKAGSTYYLSFYLNTSGLGGSATSSAQIRILDETGRTVDMVEQGASNGWILKTKNFVAPAGRSISLQLAASANAAGNIYIDDIEITPTLLARNSSVIPDSGGQTVNPFYDRQICRLFPQADSLSCDYYDDNGILQKGDRGYCLEYDRPPGDPNTCLLWWPIDKVTGSGIQTNTAKGYSGRVPLYYCTALAGQPYIDASTWHYDVDERFTLNVNGADVLNVPYLGWEQNGDCLLCAAACGPAAYLSGPVGLAFCWACLNSCGTTIPIGGHHSGNIGDHLNDGNKRIYLNYGSNDIRIKLLATYPGGVTRLKLSPASVYINGGKIGEIKILPNLLNSGQHDNFGGTLTDIGANNCFQGNAPGNTGDEFRSGSDATDGEFDGNTSCRTEGTLSYTVGITPVCGEIADVVSSAGQNKAWTERVRTGNNNYQLSCNIGMPTSPFTLVNPMNTSTIFSAIVSSQECSSTSNIAPFGSLKTPVGDIGLVSDPTQWKISSALPYYSFDEDKTGLMGQLQSASALQYLFAESYGVWDWNGSQYVHANDSKNWTAPTKICDNNVRSTSASTNCAVAPAIANMRLESSVNAFIFGRGFVNLTFNSVVDSEQAPLASYEIDWGDGEPPLVVTGSNMAARPDPASPHSVYHAYDYYDLLGKYQKHQSNNDNLAPTLSCANSVCYVKPRVKLTDNWGWCSEGIEGSPCPTGVCVNAKKVSSGTSCSSDKECSAPGFHICADGWWEPSGQVVVYEPGT